MEKIFRKLLDAYKPEQIREIFQEIGSDKIRFEPVGGRPNNIATINIGSDPAAGVTERITNAIDAVLEKEWVFRGQPVDIRTTRKATEDGTALRMEMWLEFKTLTMRDSLNYLR